MNELAKHYSDSDKRIVLGELRRLFVAQALNKTDEQMIIFCDEVFKSGLPIRYLLEGIQSLIQSESRIVTVRSIVDASREKLMSVGQEKKGKCYECSDSGAIIYKRDDGLDFAFSCPQCQKLKVGVLGGQNTITRNGHTYTRKYFDEDKIGKEDYKKAVNNGTL